MFYEQLEKLCKENNLKVTPLIKSLGISTGNISKWKNGATVNSDIAIKIAMHFGVSTDYLLTGKDAEPKEQPKILTTYNSLNMTNKIKVDGYAEGLLKEQQSQEQRNINKIS